MIDYFKGIYGTNLLLRVHGSALYKGMLVGLFSTLIYLAIELIWNKRSRYNPLSNNWSRRLVLFDSSQFDNTATTNDVESLVQDLEDPYGAGVLISGVTFLIIFRANSGYTRYWEAVSSLHQCLGKWMDATMCAASFHLQSVHYDGARPHNFYECDELNRLNLTLERRRTSGDATRMTGTGGTSPSSGLRKRTTATAAATAAAITKMNSNRLTSAFDCEKEFSGNGNIFVGSKVVDTDTSGATGGSGGGGGLLSASLSWRMTSTSQPERNNAQGRREGLQQQQLQRSWRRSLTSPTIPLFGNSSSSSSSSSIPTPLILPKSVLEGEWNIIPPTPYTTSLDMFHRTELHSRYFPSSQYSHNSNFAHRPPMNDLPEVVQQRQQQQQRHYDGSNVNGGNCEHTTKAPSKVSTTRTTTTTPPLFLQELAHLSSLACAVALSTLRNDMERGESPLGVYIPGSEWPEIDPDNLPKHVLHEFQPKYKILALLMHWLGLDRLPRYRSKYNATRPLLILGGVSDAEITFLQKARGPHAKVELANSWLKEFIIRESLAGSCGNVHPSIVSRVVQHLSDGMMGYHMARKIMYIPFPFPHAQLSTFYTVAMVLTIPFLMDQYVSASMLWFGCFLTFLTVTCLVGAHEVARELENPFRNVPNDLPLCTLHAMYNEALVTMYAGFNPDSFWDPSLYRVALEALAAKRDYVRNKNHDNRSSSRSNGNSNEDYIRYSNGDSSACRIGSAAAAMKTATSMIQTTEHESSAALMSEETLECGPDAMNRADHSTSMPPLSSLSLADARMGMRKTVSFADEMETFDRNTDIEIMELRSVLAEQAKLVEKLGRLLDEDEDD